MTEEIKLEKLFDAIIFVLCKSIVNYK